jgi:tripartite-type tricarboxylate transporter receptor subunit TctC
VKIRKRAGDGPGMKFCEIVEALKDQETKALLESQAMQIVGSSPEAFADFIKRDIAIWKQVADQARIEVR